MRPTTPNRSSANGTHFRVAAGILSAVVAGGVLGMLGWILITVRNTELTASELRGQMTAMIRSMADVYTRLSLVETEQRSRATPMAELKVQIESIARRLDLIEKKLP